VRQSRHRGSRHPGRLRRWVREPDDRAERRSGSGGGTSSTPSAEGTPGGGGGEAKQGGIWRMAITANPTAYPITAPGALTDILVNKTIYNSLVQYQLEGDTIEVVPDLAESWESAADLSEYTFKLKSG